jgi:lipopolysaccharide/colanic/teichoic acid biosynthesis glycosyltransferase
MVINSSSRSSQKNSRIKDIVKRAFDIVVSLAVLILLSPFFGLIALAIKRDTPGPVFYRGNRFGRGGKPFNILKFRTMFETSESYSGPKVTAHDDPRVTPLGRWLRDTKLNELPQFWNVLKGDMSLVGPRPEDPLIAKTWPRGVGIEILSVRPGITSPATVLYRNEETLLTYRVVLQKYMQELGPDKMRLDQLYVRYRSFWLDLDTLFWTLLILLPRLGSYSPPEDLLFVGPITRLIQRHMSWLSIDMLVTLIALSFTGLARRAFGPLNVGWLKATGMTAGFVLLFSLIGAVFGVNRISWSKATFADAYDLLPPWISALVIALLVNHWLGVFSSALILIASALALCGFIFVRYRSRLVTALLSQIMRHRGGVQQARERVLIVGSGRTAEHIAWLLAHPAYSDTYQVVGFVDDDLLGQGMRIYGSDIIGVIKDLPQLALKHDVGLILLADHRITYEEYRSIVRSCEGTSAKIAVVPDVFGSLSCLAEALPSIPQSDDGRDMSDFRCIRCMAKYVPSQPETWAEE